MEQLELKPIAEKNFEVVAKVLRELREFTTVAEIAKKCNLEPKIVAQSISKARKLLAQNSVIIINRVGEGYRVGNANEFILEADKSCRRALSHVKSMLETLGYLQKSREHDDFSDLINIVKQNVDKINTVIGKPEYEEFGSYEEYREARDEYRDETMLVPDHVLSIPFEEAKPYS